METDLQMIALLTSTYLAQLHYLSHQSPDSSTRQSAPYALLFAFANLLDFALALPASGYSGNGQGVGVEVCCVGLVPCLAEGCRR